MSDGTTTQKVLLIPGFEGIGATMEPLARNLKAQAVCLQIGFRVLEDEIEKLAESLFEVR